jgi:hypothetical protein
MMRTNFQFENQNITMVKGDTLAFNVEVFDEAGQPITVDSAFMTCKEIPTGEDFIFQKSLSDGITQSDGIMVVRVAPNDTKEAEAGEYFYDFQIGVGQDVFTIMNGTLSLMQNVT